MQLIFETVDEACEMREQAHKSFVASAAYQQTPKETFEYMAVLSKVIAGLIQLHTIEINKKLYQHGRQ